MTLQIFPYILFVIGAILVQSRFTVARTVTADCPQVDSELQKLMKIEVKFWVLERNLSVNLEPRNGEPVKEARRQFLFHKYQQDRKNLQNVQNDLNRDVDKKIQECLRVSTINVDSIGKDGKDKLEKDYRKVKAELHQLYQEYIKKLIHPDNAPAKEIDEMDKMTMDFYVPKLIELKIEERMLRSAREQLQSRSV